MDLRDASASNNIYRRERKWQSCYSIHSYNFPLFSTWQLESSIHIIATSQLKVPPTSFIIYSIKVHFFLLSMLETTTLETKLLVVFSVKEQFLSEREVSNESLIRKRLSLVSNKSLIREGLSSVSVFRTPHDFEMASSDVFDKKLMMLIKPFLLTLCDPCATFPYHNYQRI